MAAKKDIIRHVAKPVDVSPVEAECLMIVVQRYIRKQSLLRIPRGFFLASARSRGRRVARLGCISTGESVPSPHANGKASNRENFQGSAGEKEIGRAHV